MKTINQIIESVNNTKARSAWDRGVKEYALEILDRLDADTVFTGTVKDNSIMLNGADDWPQYSWGGSSLIYDWDIAERLCTPSELRKTRNGERRPNGREEWLDVQARALRQASFLIRRIAKEEV